ncbi:RlpA-like double-psi beta-barrel-protein domain-containing protein-containing protein, partial [Pholiota molesta]
ESPLKIRPNPSYIIHATKTSLLASSLLLSVVSAQTFSGRATFYNAGPSGTCGQPIQATDFAVALNAVQYSSADCGRTVTISAFGKTAQAVIKDECPGCGGNNLDFTLGLFEFFGPLSDGAIPITWSFV